jgi:hypothetical protein
VAVNRLALPEFARQLRLRDLAGPILLDIAGLPMKQRGALEAPLRAALGAEPLVQYLGLGPLGLFELRRTRIHPPLHEVLAKVISGSGECAKLDWEFAGLNMPTWVLIALVGLGTWGLAVNWFGRRA